MAISTSSADRLGHPATVDFHFDPMCPWAYQTSKWIRSVRSLTDLDIRWKFFSLEEINREDHQKHPWERDWSFGWGQMRVGAWLRRRSEDEVDRWYEAIGFAFHEDGRRTHDRKVHTEVLLEAGLPADAVEQALADPTTSDEVKNDHEVVTGRDEAFGVPTLVFPDGNHIFGPVVLPAPEGEDALALWDLTVAAARFPSLYELKRPKTRADLAQIAETFAPYLGAREWRSVQKPAP